MSGGLRSPAGPIMKILPLAVTQPDWETYIKMVETTLGFSPSVGLGRTFIKMDSPVAYLATLDFENRPLQHLRRGHFLNSTFEHFSVSFICSLSPTLTADLLTKFSNLKFLVHKGPTEYLIIITASMADWYVAVIRGLNVSQDKEIRFFFHNLFALFNILGFKEVWGDIEKSEGKDGYTVIGDKYAKN